MTLSSMLKPNSFILSALSSIETCSHHLGGKKPFSTKINDPINLNTWWSTYAVEIFLPLKSNHSMYFIWGLSVQDSNFLKLCAELDTVRSCAVWILNFIWRWALSCSFSLFPTFVLLNRGQILPSSPKQRTGLPERGSRVQAAGWLMWLI